MKMDSTATVDKPDKIKCTIRLSMSLEDWKAVRKQVDNGNYACTQVSSAISDLVYQMEQTFWPKSE